MPWTQVAYRYDGSFGGFLTCVYESYVHREAPACFLTREEGRFSLWPERTVDTSPVHARRVYRSLHEKMGREGRSLITQGFLTCLPERELHLWRLIQLGYEQGPKVAQLLTDARVLTVRKAVQQLQSEAHQFKGFVRFSDQDGLLIGEISPKNRVLPLLRPHFCARYAGAPLVLYDRTHGEALFTRSGGHWTITPVDDFHISAPGQEERDFRALWRRFYDTVAIQGRENPRCRMTHMPKRFWGNMTEFQREENDAPSLPRGRKETS